MWFGTSQRRGMHFKNRHALIVRGKGNVLEIKAFAVRRWADHRPERPESLPLDTDSRLLSEMNQSRMCSRPSPGACWCGGPARAVALSMTKTFDAIIIGAGQAGPFLAQRLAGAGMKVAILERKLFGGTCVNTGCVPTKTMVASAYAAHMVRRAADFGVVNSGSASVDMKLVKSRKDAISGQSRADVESWLRGMTNCTVYQGHGRFESSKEVSVGSERLTADRIFINVGGRAVVPQMTGIEGTPGIEGVPYLNNSSIMDVDFLPRHLIIIGGGYVGLEFAQMYRRFGSEVTIIEMGSHLAQHEDEDVSTAIREILEHEGIKVRLNATCIGFSRRGEEILTNVDCASGDPEVSGSHLLLAVGRRPNTDDLGLTNAGVAVDKRGYIVVDDYLQTSVPGIWALGVAEIIPHGRLRVCVDTYTSPKVCRSC